MAKKTTKKNKTIEPYEHRDKDRSGRRYRLDVAPDVSPSRGNYILPRL